MKLKHIKIFFIVTFFFSGIFQNIYAQKLDFSTYLVSNDEVHASPLSVTDKDGNVFVIGGTRSGLKVTKDAFQKEYQGHSNWVGGDIFLMKLSPEGKLLYSSYIGGMGNDAYAGKIVFDDFGNVYVVFSTDSKKLPVSNNAYQRYNKGNSDHYIIKFSKDCKYIAATYFGGNGSDHWPEIAINNNILYLKGAADSDGYPTTQGVIQESFNKWQGESPSQSWMMQDITITALSLELDKLYYSTYLGGSKYDVVNSLDFDKNGNLILTGSTTSENYPVTQNGYNTKINGGMDLFFTILKPDFSDVVYSSFIGGSSNDIMPKLISFKNNEIILIANTESSDFPATSDALNREFGGDKDGVISKINIKTKKLVYSSFIGGSGEDYIMYGAETKKGSYVLAGRTNSKDLPVTNNAIGKSFNGGKDLRVVLLDNSLKKIEYATYIGGSNDDAWQATPNAYLTNNDELLITTVTSSLDFPCTNKFTKIPSFEMIYLLKIDLLNN